MAEVTIDSVSSGDITGDGYFDVLMTAVTLRLEEQHRLGRIKGADYANVYLGALQSVMQQSIQFALGKQQADKQAELLSAQTAEALDGTVRANTELTDKLLTTAKQRDNVDADTSVKLVQKLEVEAATLRQNEQSDKDLLVKDAQITKVQAEKNLLDQEKLTEINKTTLTQSQNAEVLASTTRQDSVSTAQISKIGAEKALLDQKELTEVQQTTLVQKQQNLYDKQATGFDRDAEQKAVKLWTDVWTIARSTDPDATSVALPFTSTELGNILEDVATAAGLTYSA